MDDEWLMSHLENHHAEDLSMEFLPEPGRIQRRLASPSAWRAYHDAMHRLYPRKYDHRDHNEEESVSTEKIWVIGQYGEMGQVHSAYTSETAAADAINRSADPGHFDSPHQIDLERPDLRPIYGGPTLLEALWSEMDTIMERLMTGQTSEDGGDKFRAQELAWVLAIVTDPYEPSVDKIRAETMERWNASQAEAEADTQAEEQQHKFDAAGVNGYEL